MVFAIFFFFQMSAEKAVAYMYLCGLQASSSNKAGRENIEVQQMDSDVQPQMKQTFKSLTSFLPSQWFKPTWRISYIVLFLFFVFLHFSMQLS